MTTNLSCILTKVGLSLQNGGAVSICNVSKHNLRDQQNSIISLTTHSLEQAWHSPTRTEIAESLDNGIKHNNCVDCWTKEAAGAPSRRQVFNTKYGHYTTVTTAPKIIVLKPGNICNLACRHCEAGVSSGWYKDTYELDYKDISYTNFLQKFKHIRDSYEENNSNIWPILDKWSDEIEYYDLYGAEPLLIKPILTLLENSVNKNIAYRQTIHINTNGTIWREEFIDLFKQFREVKLDISIDGIDNQFNYMRYPATWKLVYNNILNYKKLSDTNKNIHVGVTVTVSAFNIFYLPKILDFCQWLDIKCTWNILNYPEYMNIKCLPKDVKDIVSKKLANKEYTNIVNFMNIPFDNNDNKFEILMERIQHVDLLRSERFEDTFPEYYELLRKRV